MGAGNTSQSVMPLTGDVFALGVCPRRRAGKLLQGVWRWHPSLWVWWKSFQVRRQGHSKQAVRLNTLPPLCRQGREPLYITNPIDCGESNPESSCVVIGKKKKLRMSHECVRSSIYVVFQRPETAQSNRNKAVSLPAVETHSQSWYSIL